MKIVILGSTGMLGNAVGNYFINNYTDVALSVRDFQFAYGNYFYLDPVKSFEDELLALGSIDYCINCIGIIKPFITKNIETSIFINSLFPHKLANFCVTNNIKLIHITTDCVFSGKSGNYTEDSLHDCTDIYGKTKSLGEPENCMTIRTSIIGKEIHNNASLIAWLQSQAGKSVNGFINHLWNGVTTKQYAKICDSIIRNNLYTPGLFHVFSDIVTKAQLLQLLNDRFNLKTSVNPVIAAEQIDRTLSTVKALTTQLDIPKLSVQISEL